MCKTQGCYTDIKFKYLPDTVPDTGVLLLAGAALAARGKGSGRGFLTYSTKKKVLEYSRALRAIKLNYWKTATQ